MTKLALGLALSFALAACGGAALQTISLSNQTQRTIKELYVYPAGAKDKGASRGALAPSTGTQVKMAAGNVEVYAISETVKIDEHTRDTPTASQTLEVHGPLEVVFYDGDQKPASVSRPGVIGVSFIVSDKKPAPASADAPADDAAPDPAPAP